MAHLCKWSCRLDILLNDVEVRVLGSLIEKDITTPDYYPLSLNALVNACNQKNNRDPVMSLDEDGARRALHSLQEKRLAGPAPGADSRVTKYEHRLQEAFNFDRREIALICVLLLRGPQTLGELRSRAERMHKFGDLDEVQATLQHLAQREPPLVKIMPRQPGTKEMRYVHLFSAVLPAWEAAPAPVKLVSAPEEDRLGRLEQQMAELRDEIAGIKEEFRTFRKQFD